MGCRYYKYCLLKTTLFHIEREGQNLDVYITSELLNLTAKIAKGITRNKGHLLLVGKSGVGRKTSVKILSGLYNHKLVIPTTDNIAHFNNELKQVTIF